MLEHEILFLNIVKTSGLKIQNIKMSSLIKTIERLGSSAGIAINPQETAALTILQNETTDLEAHIQAQRLVLAQLEEQVRYTNTELEGKKECHSLLLDKLRSEVDTTKQKSDILKNYAGVLVGSDDFLMNKLKNECDSRVMKYFEELKPIKERGSNLKTKLDSLRKIQKECDELRQKVNE